MNKVICLLTGGHSYIDQNNFCIVQHDNAGEVVGLLVANKCTKCNQRTETFIPLKNIFDPAIQKALQH